MQGDTSLSRRTFLKGSVVAATAFGLGPRLSAEEAAGGRKIPLSLQLYSVRGDCGKNFDGALERVAKMGFDGVEFAGYYGYNGKAAELRK